MWEVQQSIRFDGKPKLSVFFSGDCKQRAKYSFFFECIQCDITNTICLFAVDYIEYSDLTLTGKNNT